MCIDSLPAKLKNVVLILLSIRSIVIVTDHIDKNIRSTDIPVDRILIIVVKKYTAPRIEKIPAEC